MIVGILILTNFQGNAKKKDLQDMLTELDLMKTLRPHPHLVDLIGCCIEKGTGNFDCNLIDCSF